MANEAKWYALYTSPRAEKKVSARLDERRIEHYLPMQRTLKQWSDRKKWVEEPLFKSYLFVKITEADYYDVLNLSGVVKYVSFGGKAATVPDRQIETIKRLLSEEVPLEVSYERLQTGAPVEVVAGPLMGTLGELISYRGDKRLAVKIHTIDTTLLVSIPENFIEPIQDQHKIELLDSIRTPKFAIRNE
ncbi:MAG: UpxY family transcription antiterminator [Bacteroidetes bacterium]|nr:MAG: UpxY family transcription antiterminator [Bacteroidota bacterium]